MPHDSRRIPQLTVSNRDLLRVSVWDHTLLRCVEAVRRSVDRADWKAVREVLRVACDVVQIASRPASAVAEPQVCLHVNIASLDVTGCRLCSAGLIADPRDGDNGNDPHDGDGGQQFEQREAAA